MMPCSVRRAEPRDLPRLADLFEAYRAFYGKPPRRADAVAFLEQRFALADSILLVAADAADVLLGFAQLYPLHSSLNMKRAWLLNDLFVDPNARGTGVGRALLARSEEVARSTDASSIELFTEQTNATARRLYEAVGYQLDEAFAHYEKSLLETRQP